jgi:hypothetical protein
MSSYSPSIKTIIHGRRRLDPKVTPARALLVAIEYTPGYSRLSFANKEVAMLRGLSKSMSLDTMQPGRRKQDITSNLTCCKIFSLRWPQPYRQQKSIKEPVAFRQQAE